MLDTSPEAQVTLVALRAVLGPDDCLLGRDLEKAGNLWDASASADRSLPLALLRPRTTAQLSDAMRICHAHGQRVVIQGGLTGLAGGANPVGGEIAISMSRMVGVEEIDAQSSTMTVLAGTVLEAAQDAARDAGFLLPIDLGARGSCHVGGVVATNAGGFRVIAHGTVRESVLGMECVLADGTVLSHLSKVTKDNTGYNLGQLIIGSEGTLAVVTRVVLRLKPLPAPAETALCALPDFAAAVRMLELARQRLQLSAFEIMWSEQFLLCGGRGLFADEPALVLLLEGEGPGIYELLEFAFADGLVTDALIAESIADARRYWDIRDLNYPERPLDHPVNLDVSLPISAMEAFVHDCLAGFAALDPRIEGLFFGHMGDGNLHAVILLPEAGDDLAHAVSKIAYDLVQQAGGSVSAEHGIGTLKRKWLGYSRSPEEIGAMRAIKAALDPQSLLNPGKLFLPQTT